MSKLFTHKSEKELNQILDSIYKAFDKQQGAKVAPSLIKQKVNSIISDKAHELIKSTISDLTIGDLLKINQMLSHQQDKLDLNNSVQNNKKEKSSTKKRGANAKSKSRKTKTTNSRSRKTKK